ncbi:hypothetical protein SD22575_5195 [Shigella dysenteriae 225-75]|nr:hypothetical protein SD22575_5195 [Shigella dysenteriae 225-75]
MPGATLARLLQPGQARQGRLIPPHTPDSATDTGFPKSSTSERPVTLKPTFL